MNDPTKVIEVEKSSLLSLKVEVLKKQEEIRKRKELNAPQIKIGKGQKFKEAIKLNEEKKAEKAKVIEVDDSSDLAKSKRMLEAKAKYYERMTKQGTTTDDPSSLVLFAQKKKEAEKKDL